MQTQEILEYQNEVDKYLLSKKYKIKENLKEIDFSDKESEEYNMMLEDSLSEEYRKFEQFYQNNLRFSTILFSYSCLEYQLKKICNHIQDIKKLPFSVKDLQGQGDIEKVKKYLEKTCNLDLKVLNPEWDFINKLRLVRNTIVHSKGEFELSKDKDNTIAQFVKQHSSLTVKHNLENFEENIDDTYEIKIIDEKLNHEFVENITTFFDKLLKNIENNLKIN